jgi:hypothetical protein
MSSVIETPVSPTDAARALLVQIRSLQASVNGFTFSRTPDPRSLNSAGSVPPAFLEAVAVALDASPELAAACKVAASEIRSDAVYVNAFTPVAEELELMARAVRHTLAIHRNETGLLALGVYSLAKTFNRRSGRQLPVAHLENMRRALGKTKRKPESGSVEPPPPAGASRESGSTDRSKGGSQ